MLITLECVILALQAVAAVRLALESPFEITGQSNNRLSKRSPVVLDGDITKCYTIKVNVDGVNVCIMSCIVVGYQFVLGLINLTLVVLFKIVGFASQFSNV